MKTDIRQHFDAIAPKRESFVRRNHYYYDDLIRFLKHVVSVETRVVELGCGIGNVIDALPNRDKTGIDFSEKMIELAQQCRRSETRYLIDDIEDLEHNERYDYVLMLDTASVLVDIQQALTSVREKLCTDRTRLVLTYYNVLWEPLLRIGDLLGIKTPMPRLSWLSRADVRGLLELAGFEVVSEGERLILPRFFPLLSWLLNTIIAKLPGFRRLCLTSYVIARPRASDPTEFSVSIVIPIRNEAGNVERALQSTPHFGTSQELIFVEGNSTDDSWDVIQRMYESYKSEWDIKIMQQPGSGKGDAVRTGFAAATKEVLMILDGDLTVDPSELPKFYEVLATGAGEFVNGSRLVYPMEKEAMQLLNMGANKCFGTLFSWLLGQPVKDTLCGTKVLRKSDYEKIAANRHHFGSLDPFGDFDLLFGAAKQNLRIVDVPIRYKQRTYGSTNISRWRHGWLLLRMCVLAARKIKFR
jgi:SAM-dependent methyltransferase